MSTGNARVDQHGGDRDRGRRADGAGQVGRGRRPAARARPRTARRRPRPAGCRRARRRRTAAAATPSRASTRCSTPTGVTGPAGVGDHVHEPALDPEPAVVVQVADVAGAVPAGRAGARALGGPEPVVAVLDVRGPHADLAGHAGGGHRVALAGAVGGQRADRDRDAAEGPADADAVAAARRPPAPTARCRSPAAPRSCRTACAGRPAASAPGPPAAATPGPARRRTSAAGPRPGRRGAPASGRPAVATTLRRAAGEAKTTVARRPRRRRPARRPSGCPVR